VTVVPFRDLPATEILAIEIWKILEKAIPSITDFGTLYSIKLYETPRNYVEYFGD